MKFSTRSALIGLIWFSCCAAGFAQNPYGWKPTAGPNGAAVVSTTATDSTICVGTRGTGVFCSDDNGASWRGITAGLTDFYVYSLAQNSDYLFAGTDENGVFRLAKGSNTWQPASRGITDLEISSLVTSGPNLIAGTYDGGVFISNDSGQSWVQREGEVGTVYSLTRTGSKVYAGGVTGAWVSEDDGISWSPLERSGLPFFSNRFIDTGQFLFVFGGNGETVSRSSDGGKSWSDLSARLPTTYVSEAVLVGTQIVVATVDGIFSSPNNGDGWLRYSGGLGELETYSLIASNTLLFAGSKDGVVYTHPFTFPSIAPVSAASYAYMTSGDAIVAIFGVGLADSTLTAPTLPLPLDLGGVAVTVIDEGGTERKAPLFYVSPGQINFLMPNGVALGNPTVIVSKSGEPLKLGDIGVRQFAPSLFSANSNGRGVASAVALRVRPDNTQRYEPVAQFSPALNQYIPTPIILGPSGDKVYLILYGTGIRNAPSGSVFVQVGPSSYNTYPVGYAGPQGFFVGLDQVNFLIPTSIARGEQDIRLRAEDQVSNTVRVRFQ